MTNAPLHVVREILRGRPSIEKINDDTFALVPTIVKENPVTPVYFDQLPDDDQTLNLKAIKTYKCKICKFKSRSAAGLATHKRTSHRDDAPPDPLFFEKLLLALYKTGGSSEIDVLRRRITTVKGEIPRKNNTRREVYRRPQWLGFDPANDQIMVLSDAGRAYVEGELREKYGHPFIN